MEREAIEFHDSVLARIDPEGEWIRVHFEPAYVHRSSGEPALDAGTGWSANVQLTIFGSTVPALSSDLPYDVNDGSLRIGLSMFNNIVPIPLDGTGDVAVEIVLRSGEIVKLSGTRAELMVVGPYEFIEDVAAG